MAIATQYLEWREKQYDMRVRVDVFGRESAEQPIVKGALVYIASADCVKNLNYAGTELIPPGNSVTDGFIQSSWRLSP